MEKRAPWKPRLAPAAALEVCVCDPRVLVALRLIPPPEVPSDALHRASDDPLAVEVAAVPRPQAEVARSAEAVADDLVRRGAGLVIRARARKPPLPRVRARGLRIRTSFARNPGLFFSLCPFLYRGSRGTFSFPLPFSSMRLLTTRSLLTTCVSLSFSPFVLCFVCVLFSLRRMPRKCQDKKTAGRNSPTA